MDQGQAGLSRARLRLGALSLAALACTASPPASPDGAGDDSAREPAFASPQQAPRPVIPVYATGGERGALEPCGCASGQLGGLSRRATALSLLRPDPAAALTLSCGDLSRGSDALDALILETAMGALADMRYDAHVPSATTLSLGRDALQRALDQGVPFLAANVEGRAGAATGFLPLLVKTVQGTPVTVAGLVLPDGAGPADYVLLDPLQALARMQPPDVLVVAGPLAAARDLAHDAERGTLVLVGDQEAGPTTRVLDGHVASPGARGHYLLVGASGTPSGPLQVVPLDETWPRHAGTDLLVEIHRQRIVREGLLDDLYERRPLAPGQAYVGPAACAPCHPEAHRVWKTSRHAHALASLLPDERHLDPDCLACHTTGFGRVGGYAGPERRPEHATVGCESCHGPGAAHAATPGQAPLTTAVQCLACHDPENSPRFDRLAYWPRIEHGL